MQNITKFPTTECRIIFTRCGVEDADDEDGDTSQVQVDPGHLFDIILEYKYKHVSKANANTQDRSKLTPATFLTYMRP